MKYFMTPRPRCLGAIHRATKVWLNVQAVALLLSSLAISAQTAERPDRSPGLATNQVIQTRTPGLVADLQWIGETPPNESEAQALLAALTASQNDEIEASPGERSLTGQDREARTVVAELEAYLQRRPNTGYRAAVHSGLAGFYTGRGVYSKALEHWDRAEQLSRGESESAGQVLHDQALAQRGLLLACLGKVAEFEELAAVKARRPLQGGPAQDTWVRAVEVYQRLKYQPELGFRCGVFALAAMAKASGAKFDDRTLLGTLANPRGMTLQELENLARGVGYPVQAVRHQPGTDLVVPSVAHYRGDHFVALVARDGQRYQISDPSLGKTAWVQAEDILGESTGVYLVPVAQVSREWQQLKPGEARQIIGRGSACLALDNEDGILAECEDPPCCSNQVPGRGRGGDQDNRPGWGMSSMSSRSTSTIQPAANRRGDCQGCGSVPGQGMPVWRVSEPFLNLFVEDTPLFYTPALGPEMAFTLSHRQRVGDHPEAMFQKTSFGYGWHCNWLSQVDIGGNGVTVGHPGGRLGWYDFLPSSAVLSEQNYWDNSRVEKRFDAAHRLIGYQLHQPNGGRLVYEYRDPDTLEYYLTERVTPEGHSMRISYDASSRADYIQDASGNRTYFRYQHPAASRLVTRLDQQMRVNGSVQTVRTASFEYTQINSTWRLTALTDAAGIRSSIAYNADGWIGSMTTPYGTTSFSYSSFLDPVRPPTTPTDPPYVRWVVINEPEGLESAYMMVDDDAPGMPASFQTHQYPAPYEDLNGSGPGTGMFPGDSMLDLPLGSPPSPVSARNKRNTFYWNPAQWASLGKVSINDLSWTHFRRARIRHWLWENQEHIDTLSYEQAPALDDNVEGQVTFYDYADKSRTYSTGSQIYPSLIARKLPDGTIWYQKLSRNPLGKITKLTETYSLDNGTIGLRTSQRSYAANGIDLLSETEFAPGNQAGGDTIRSLSYNTHHQVTRVSVSPDHGHSYSTHFTYDGQRRLLSINTPNGLTREFSYGPDGYLQQLSDAPVVRTESFTWEAGEVKTHTDARGLLRQFTYDDLGRIQRVDYPDNTYETFGYTAQGSSGGAKILDLTWVRDREGTVTEYRYDGLGRLTSVRDAQQQSTRYGYCDCGALTSITDPLNHQTTFTVDNQGNRTGIVLPNKEGTITQTYDRMGRLTGQDNGVSQTRFLYNNQGLLTAVENGTVGRELTAVYNLNDHPVTVTDAQGVTTVRSFDRLGRLQTRTDAHGGQETFTYNASGLTTYRDPLLEVTRYSYDEAARRTRVTSPKGEEIDYFYDSAGDLVGLNDGNDQLTQWGYDREGRMTAKTNAVNQVVLKLKYDPLGRVTSRTDAAGQETRYDYDSVGNLIGVDYSDGTPDVRFTYNARHELSTMIDGLGTTSFKHTAAGRFEDEDGPWSSDRVSYSYNSAGQRTRMSVVGWVQDYRYDGAQRLDRILAPSGTFQYTYPTGAGTLSRASRQWERLVLPGGHEIRQTYDTLARLTKTTLRNSSGQPLNRHEYRFNARHQRDRQTFLAGNTIDYDYDPNGQLTSAMGREANSALRLHEQLTYDYDSAWNLRERTRNELTTQLANNRVNELTSGTRSGKVTASGMSRSSLASVEANGASGQLYADHSYAIPGLNLPDGSTDLLTKGTDGGGQTFHHLSLLKLPVAVTYQYDANGNLISDGERNFEYDAENRLILYEEHEKIQHRYIYDGFNRMRQRITSFWDSNQSAWQTIANTQFIYDGMNVVQERDALNGGVPQVTYTRGLDLSSSLEGAGGIGGMLAYTDHSTGADRTAYYHADGNGNITAMINGAGRVVARYHYDPYGNLLGMAGPLAQENRYRYSSKQAQPYSELYYYGYRFYDPSLQRWINQDPIGEAGGVNLFGFVGNDPMNVIDPLGLDRHRLVGGYLFVYPPWWKFWKTEPDVYAGNSQLYQSVLRREGIEDALVNAAVALAALELQKQLLEEQERRQTPPENCPRPPGWNEKWSWEPPTREKRSDAWRWFDPEGGEWRRHDDANHDPHWDYNPWKSPTDKWRNVDDDGQFVWPFKNYKPN